MPISRLEKLPLRELWKHEAHRFTKWLADNLDFVSEATGMELTLVEREAAAGPFSADIWMPKLQSGSLATPDRSTKKQSIG